MNETTKQLGEHIRKLRQLGGFTQEKLAEIAELHVTFLGEIERGTKSPTVDTLVKLSSALGISLSELMAFESGAKVAASREEKLQELLQEYSYKIRQLYEKD